jgi:hypothetical protein
MRVAFDRRRSEIRATPLVSFNRREEEGSNFVDNIFSTGRLPQTSVVLADFGADNSMAMVSAGTCTVTN